MPEEIFETPQPTPSVTEPKTTNWPKAILATIFGLALLLGAAYAGYWYGTESAKVKTQSTKPTPTVSQPTPTPTTTTANPTAGWKIYTNQSLGINFKYPSTWLDAEINTLATRASVTIKDGEEINDVIVKLDVARGVYYNQNLQREMELNEVVDKQNFPSEALTSEEITLEDWKGYRYTYHVHGVGYFTTAIFLARPDSPADILSIVYRHDNNPSEYKSAMPETLDQILSTFKFLD